MLMYNSYVVVRVDFSKQPRISLVYMAFISDDDLSLQNVLPLT